MMQCVGNASDKMVSGIKISNKNTRSLYKPRAEGLIVIPINWLLPSTLSLHLLVFPIMPCPPSTWPPGKFCLRAIHVALALAWYSLSLDIHMANCFTSFKSLFQGHTIYNFDAPHSHHHSWHPPSHTFSSFYPKYSSPSDSNITLFFYCLS